MSTSLFFPFRKCGISTWLIDKLMHRKVLGIVWSKQWLYCSHTAQLNNPITFTEFIFQDTQHRVGLHVQNVPNLFRFFIFVLIGYLNIYLLIYLYFIFNCFSDEIFSWFYYTWTKFGGRVRKHIHGPPNPSNWSKYLNRIHQDDIQKTWFLIIFKGHL